MGMYDNYCPEPRKRKDYSISEVEKKYSNLELSRLILYNIIYNYPPPKIFPDRLCSECNKNKVTEKSQLSQNTECLDCYIKEKKKNYDCILKIIEEEELTFEGDCMIDNKLYLGNIRSSFLKEDLKKIGITHILMIGYYMTPIYPNDFIYENIEINDFKNENILQHLVKGIKFIEESNICYTHCQVGRSRSASFVIAYIMYKNKIHFSKAFDYVRKKRRIAFPNEGFQWQLEDFDIILNNFDYNLEKCDEFIRDFFENRKKLEESEKDYLEKKRLLEKEKVSLNNYSDSEEESDEEQNSKDNNNDVDENKENNENEKEIENKIEKEMELELNNNNKNNENIKDLENKIEKNMEEEKIKYEKANEEKFEDENK